MHIFKISGLVILFFLVSGCVTPARQSEILLANPPSKLPLSSIITQVEFIDQTTGYCGPAALTMLLRWVGKDIGVDQVAAQVYTPKLKGSLQTDLISATRRQGLMAVTINNMESLLIEIAAGHPVIIFENLSFNWAPNWHYAVVVGYDLQKQEIILHSGHQPFYHWDIKKFERSWMLGDYWGLVVLPAGELSASGSELSNLAGAAGLEQAGKYIEAEKSYQKILQKWPHSLVALVGLANLAYQKGQRSKSINLLRLAVKYHPDSFAAKHNLGVVETSAMLK